MVLAGMNLLDDTADAGAIVADDHEKVFGDESHRLIRRHYLYVSEPLLIRAHLVLALDDEYAALLQDAIRLSSPVVIELKDSLVILAPCPVSGSVIAVVILELVVNRVSGATWGMHVGRVENDAIERFILVGQRAAVYAVLEVCSFQFIFAVRDVSPENALAVGNVSDLAAWLHVQPKNVGENLIIGFAIGTENQLVRWPAVFYPSFFLLVRGLAVHMTVAVFR
jgi:hypothetical protein